MPTTESNATIHANEPIIICPNCKTEIKLNESLAAPIVESIRQQFAQKLAAKDKEIGEREAAVRKQQVALSEAKNSIDEQLAEKLKEVKAQIASDEAKKARHALSLDLENKDKEVAHLSSVLKEREAKLSEAQKAQAELIRKERELEDAKREFSLTVEKQVTLEGNKIREKATKDAEEKLKLTVLEKDNTISALKNKLDDAVRRAEQGSQQLQGEVQELELESILRNKFPTDTIEPVPKGEHGGDVLHRVISPLGQMCGTILWESKRTRNWSDSWLSKLRDDQRSAKAEIALIISHALPKGVETFDRIDGVWIAEPRYIYPIALALRNSLIELAESRQTSEGQQTKMELVYQYLTGQQFRHRVEAIVEKFHDMREDLDKERKAMTRLWAKREEQINRVNDSIAGMYGDLQGIAGKTLKEIEGLSLALDTEKPAEQLQMLNGS
jgi:hypothetical protein